MVSRQDCAAVMVAGATLAVRPLVFAAAVKWGPLVLVASCYLVGTGVAILAAAAYARSAE